MWSNNFVSLRTEGKRGGLGIVGLNLRDVTVFCHAIENLRLAGFTGCNLEQANFKNAVCRAGRFIGANLACADFSRADVSGADFSGASMYRTRLHKIIEEHAIWTGAGREKALGTDRDRAEAENFVFAPS